MAKTKLTIEEILIIFSKINKRIRPIIALLIAGELSFSFFLRLSDNLNLSDFIDNDLIKTLSHWDWDYPPHKDKVILALIEELFEKCQLE